MSRYNFSTGKQDIRHESLVSTNKGACDELGPREANLFTGFSQNGFPERISPACRCPGPRHGFDYGVKAEKGTTEMPPSNRGPESSGPL